MVFSETLRRRAACLTVSISLSFGCFSVFMVLEQSSLNLVAEDGPFRIGLFFTPVQFEVGTGANLLDQFTKSKWFPAMCGSRCKHPAADIVTTEWQIPAYPEQQKFV